MLWIKSGIENPSKSEVIGRCGGDEKSKWPHIFDSTITCTTNADTFPIDLYAYWDDNAVVAETFKVTPEVCSILTNVCILQSLFISQSQIRYQQYELEQEFLMAHLKFHKILIG